MSNRPDFKSYLKYRCKKIFGTNYASQAVSCKSGKEYAMVKSLWTKIILLIFAMAITAVTYFFISNPNVFPFAPIVFWILIYLIVFVIHLQNYFSARFQLLDDSDNLCMSHASKKDRPPIKDYLKHYCNKKSKTKIRIVFESKDGQNYYENTNKYSSLIIAIIFFLLLMVWVYTGIYMSIIHIVVTILAILLLYLIVSPVQYFFSEFHAVDHSANEKIQGNRFVVDTSKTTSSEITVIVLIFLGVIAIPFFMMYHSIFNQECKSLPMAKDTTYAEAYDISQAYADEQCGDAHLLRFYIDIDGEDAVKTRQPTDWMLEFQDPPTGLFSLPNQTMHITKVSETKMIANHDIPAFPVSMSSAPTLPVDVNEILNVLETNLSISLNNMNPSYIRIWGGSMMRDRPLRNTCYVSIRCDKTNTYYIVDFEDKTAQKIDYEPDYF